LKIFAYRTLIKKNRRSRRGRGEEGDSYFLCAGQVGNLTVVFCPLLVVRVQLKKLDVLF